MYYVSRIGRCSAVIVVEGEAMENKGWIPWTGVELTGIGRVSEVCNEIAIIQFLRKTRWSKGRTTATAG